MKITNSSDWRDAIPFDTPVLAAQAAPGEPARCAGCGPDVAPYDRTDLWLVKHRHPNNPAGFVRLYCLDHRPKVALAPTAASGHTLKAPKAPRSARPSAPRERRVSAPTIPERPKVYCPDCFVEVSAAGVCTMCGTQVA